MVNLGRVDLIALLTLYIYASMCVYIYVYMYIYKYIYIYLQFIPRIDQYLMVRVQLEDPVLRHTKIDLPIVIA